MGMGGSLVECEPKIPWLESEGDVDCADPNWHRRQRLHLSFRCADVKTETKDFTSGMSAKMDWIGWDGMQQRKSLNDVERFSWTVLLFKARAIGTD